MKYENITPEEIERYTTQLVPLLAREPAWKWVRIDSIAKDVARFIAVCQCLTDEGGWFLHDRYPIIDVWKDSLVRLSPDYMTEVLKKPLTQ